MSVILKILFKAIIGFNTLAIISCNTDNEKITLEDWISEKNRFEVFKEFSKNQNNCDSVEILYEKLELEEFKKLSYMELASCFLNNGNNEKSEKYILKSFEAGQHISYIDSIKFSKIYSQIKNKYPKLNREFWKARDTCYFQDIEAMVDLDQSTIKTSISNSTEQNKEIARFAQEKAANYLLEYSEKNDFPWGPSPNYFNSKFFRYKINPELLAIHAPVKDKLKLLNYSIESAEKGKISWRIPTGIFITFYTRVPRKQAKPLYFLHFDKESNLEVGNSYLQLYSLNRYMVESNISKIKIQPTHVNSLDEKVIVKQLQEIRKVLIKKFLMEGSSIEISNTPNNNENDQQEVRAYNYSFTSF